MKRYSTLKQSDLLSCMLLQSLTHGAMLKGRDCQTQFGMLPSMQKVFKQVAPLMHPVIVLQCKIASLLCEQPAAHLLYIC